MLMLHMMLIIRIRLEGTSAQPLPHTSSGNRMHVYVFTCQHPSVEKVARGDKMQSFRSEHESGRYLARLQGYGGGGEQVFRLDCQERDKWGGGREHPRREKKKKINVRSGD